MIARQPTCLFLGPPGKSSDQLRELLKSLRARFALEWGLDLEISTLETGRGQYGELAPNVSESIYRSLELADLVIADITNGHPNVMYEVGFAHALKKPVLPLVQKGAGQIPTDLSGYLYFTYELGPSSMENLSGVLYDWIGRNLKVGRKT